MIDHIGEAAALYALGMLDDVESAEVMTHAATCDACRRLLAQAEDDVTAMAAAQQQLEPPADLAARLARSIASAPAAPRVASRSWYAPVLAFAAAIAIAILPTSYLISQNQSMHRSMVYADAVERMMSSPHRTVAFTGSHAMVMYGTDGSWYCIFASGATALHVAWLHDGQKTDLGTMVPHDDVALLYLPKSHRMDQLAIMNDGQIVSQANLVF